MVTAILILACVALVLLFATMGYAAMNGCLVSQIWWMTGGAGTIAEIIFKFVGEIIKNLTE